MFEHVINVGIHSNYYSCFVTTISLFFSSFSLDFLSSFFFFFFFIILSETIGSTGCTKQLVASNRYDEREYALLTGMIRERKKSTGDICRSRYWKIETVSDRPFSLPPFFFSSSFLSSYSSELSVFRKYFQRHSVTVLPFPLFHIRESILWLKCDLKRFSKLSSNILSVISLLSKQKF